MTRFYGHVVIRAQDSGALLERGGTDRKWPGCGVPGFQQEALPRSPKKDSPAASSGESGSVHPAGQLGMERAQVLLPRRVVG